MGRAITEYLKYFQWQRVALFYTDDLLGRKCHSVAQGLLAYMPKQNLLSVHTVSVEGDEPSEMEIDMFLNHFKTMARGKVSF